MKKTFFPLVATFYLSLAVNAQTLKNPSFEIVAGSGNEIEGWGHWGNQLQQVDVLEWSPVYDGEGMLAYKHWEAKGSGDSGIFQDAGDIQAGSRYEFSVQVFLDQPEWGSLPDFIELRLESNIEGKIVTVAFNKWTPQSLPTDEWKTLRIVGTAPTDNLRVLILVAPSENPGGAVKLDTATLTLN